MVLSGIRLNANRFPRLQYRTIFMTDTVMEPQESVQRSSSLLFSAYLAGVRAVLPHGLIQKYLKRDNSVVVIGDCPHKLNKNVHLVGFGKAVINMVKPIENILKDEDGTSHLVSGVISVPCNIRETIKNRDLLPEDSSVVEILEGAQNNIPDRAAHNAAKKILNLVENLNSNELLLVLISGGGSALLPMPTPPLSVEEKSGIVRSLSRAGADIGELNCVRRALSDVKGGKLVTRTKAKVITLVLSDVINNPLDVIASGPTVPNQDGLGEASKVLQKFNIPISSNMAEVLRNETKLQNSDDFLHVTNYIIGDNIPALEASKQYIKQELEDEGLEGIVYIASSNLNGDANVVGECLAQLSLELIPKYNKKSTGDIVSSELLDQLCVTDRSSFVERVADGLRRRKALYLLFGGETTVTVTGSGLGGRNQQMVLAAALRFKQGLGADCGEELSGSSVVLLSAGTDGIDGPTPAAGALTYWTARRCQLDEAATEGLVAEDFLKDNNSNAFFNKLKGGKYLLQPGHTATNVMDLQMLRIQPPSAITGTSPAHEGGRL